MENFKTNIIILVCLAALSIIYQLMIPNRAAQEKRYTIGEVSELIYQKKKWIVYYINDERYEIAFSQFSSAEYPKRYYVCFPKDNPEPDFFHDNTVYFGHPVPQGITNPPPNGWTKEELMKLDTSLYIQKRLREK